MLVMPEICLGQRSTNSQQKPTSAHKPNFCLLVEGDACSPMLVMRRWAIGGPSQVATVVSRAMLFRLGGLNFRRAPSPAVTGTWADQLMFLWCTPSRAARAPQASKTLHSYLSCPQVICLGRRTAGSKVGRPNSSGGRRRSNKTSRTPP